MLILILLFLLGGVAEDPSPFSKGVVTDGVPGGGTPPLELPGPPVMGGHQKAITAI